MKIIPDTPIWSLVLRRHKPSPKIQEVFSQMIEDGLVVLPGIIKQELLSGLKTSQHFALVSAKLEYFSSLLATDADHILAARLFNRCQKVGIQGSHVDFLICALAIHNECSIFTTDKDFSNYRKVFEIDVKVVSP